MRGLIGRPNGHKEAVAVELELTAKSQARYREIFANYARKREVWAFWYVVKKATIGKQIEQSANVFRYQGGPQLYWSILDEVLKEPRKARVHSFNESNLLVNLFTQTKQKPAQATPTIGNKTAQPVSNTISKP